MQNKYHHIVKLEILNFQKVKAITIDAKDKDVVVLTGKNRQGKSSALDSIATALFGDKASPKDPIRDDQEYSKINIDFGDYQVVREYFKEEDGFRTTMDVFDKRIDKDNPKKVKRKQSLLNELMGSRCIDIGGFIQAPLKDKIKALIDITGYDFVSLDDKRDKLYSERQSVNREVKNLKLKIDEINIPENIPETKTLDELYKEKNKIQEHNNLVKMKLKDFDIIDSQILSKNQQIDSVIANIDRLTEELDKLRDDVDLLKEKKKERESFTLEEKSFSHIDEEIKKAFDIQKISDVLKNKKLLQSMHDEKKSISDKLSNEIKKIDDEKEDLISMAKMPIEGLSFDSKEIYFSEKGKKIPSSQWSLEQSFTVFTHIACALKPKIRVIYIKDSFAYDEEEIEKLCQFTKDNGFQLFLEKATVSPEKDSFHIVDGEIYSHNEEEVKK